MQKIQYFCVLNKYFNMADNSNKGGKFKGSSHLNGGIDFKVIEGGENIEVEGDEPLICSEALKDTEIHEYKGTNFQILNYINKTVGAKGLNEKATEVHAGDTIICKKTLKDKSIKTLVGTHKEIISAINSEAGCKNITSGGSISKNGEVVNYGKGGKVGNKIKIYSEEELKARSQKKKDSIENMAKSIKRLRNKVNEDLKSEDEKEFLTALVVYTMIETSERVGNGVSADNGHYGVTGFMKDHITISDGSINLKYTGKSGVDHEKVINNQKLAALFSEAIKKSSSKNVFTTSEGFDIKNDRINRYLKSFNVTAKDIRGYSANKWMVSKLSRLTPEEDEAKRKKQFNKVAKEVAKKVGHGASTLKKHYMLPEIMDLWIEKGEVLDLSKFQDMFKEGGEVKNQKKDSENKSKSRNKIAELMKKKSVKKLENGDEIGNQLKTPRRYFVEVDFTVNESSDEEAEKEAKRIASELSDKYDNRANVTHLYRQEFGKIGTEKIFKDGDEIQEKISDMDNKKIEQGYDKFKVIYFIDNNPNEEESIYYADAFESFNKHKENGHKPRLEGWLGDDFTIIDRTPILNKGDKVRMFDDEPKLTVVGITEWSDKKPSYNLRSEDGTINRKNISETKLMDRFADGGSVGFEDIKATVNENPKNIEEFKKALDDAEEHKSKEGGKYNSYSNSVSITQDNFFRDVVSHNPFLLTEMLEIVEDKLKTADRFSMHNFFMQEFKTVETLRFVENINEPLWNYIPAKFKTAPKVREISFEAKPMNKGLDKIMSPFLGRDDLRPILTGIYFDKKRSNIVATNAHILLSINSKIDLEGDKTCHTQSSHDKDVKSLAVEVGDETEIIESLKGKGIVDSDGCHWIEGQYPNYDQIIPRGFDHKITVKAYDIYKFLYIIHKNKLDTNPITYAVGFKFDDFKISFNSRFMITALKAMMQLGHEEIDILTTRPERAIVIVPKGKAREAGGDTDLALVMPTMLNDESNQWIIDLENNCIENQNLERLGCANVNDTAQPKDQKSIEKGSIVKRKDGGDARYYVISIDGDVLNLEMISNGVNFNLKRSLFEGVSENVENKYLQDYKEAKKYRDSIPDLEAQRAMFPIVLEWTEGFKNLDNKGYNSIEELEAKFKTLDVSGLESGTYIKNKVWVKGYPSDIVVYVGNDETDYNPSNQSLLSWLEKQDTDFSFNKYSIEYEKQLQAELKKNQEKAIKLENKINAVESLKILQEMSKGVDREEIQIAIDDILDGKEENKIPTFDEFYKSIRFYKSGKIDSYELPNGTKGIGGKDRIDWFKSRYNKIYGVDAGIDIEEIQNGKSNGDDLTGTTWDDGYTKSIVRGKYENPKFPNSYLVDESDLETGKTLGTGIIETPKDIIKAISLAKENKEFRKDVKIKQDARKAAEEVIQKEKEVNALNNENIDYSGMSAMQKGRLVAQLDKKWRIDGETVSMGEMINKGEFVRKSFNIQKYSNKKINMEYKELSTPKQVYTLWNKDGGGYNVSKLIYDAVNLPSSNYIDGVKYAEGGEIDSSWGDDGSTPSNNKDYNNLFSLYPDSYTEAKNIWNKLSEDQREGFIHDLEVTDAASEHIAENWLEFVNSSSEEDYWENATDWEEYADGGVVYPKNRVTAKNWWSQTLSMNEHKELLTKYDEYFNKMESHKLYSPYNKNPYPSQELVVKMWEKEGSPEYSEYLFKQYGYGDLTDKDISAKIREGKVSRVDKMVSNWNEEGKAFSHIDNDDSEFFQKIGIDSDEIGTTSQTGTDIVYYNDKIWNSDLKRIMAKGGDVSTKKPRKRRRTKKEMAQARYEEEVDAYKWYIVEISTKLVKSGFESKEDAEEARKDFDVTELGKDAKEFKTVSKRGLDAMGIDSPNDKWKKMKEGGVISDFKYDPEIDYLEQYELLPQAIQDALFEDEIEEPSYEDNEKMLVKLKPLGWTYEYGLDSTPYSLRPIGEPEQEFEKGGIVKGEKNNNVKQYKSYEDFVKDNIGSTEAIFGGSSMSIGATKDLVEEEFKSAFYGAFLDYEFYMNYASDEVRNEYKSYVLDFYNKLLKSPKEFSKFWAEFIVSSKDYNYTYKIPSTSYTREGKMIQSIYGEEGKYGVIQYGNITYHEKPKEYPNFILSKYKNKLSKEFKKEWEDYKQEYSGENVDYKFENGGEIKLKGQSFGSEMHYVIPEGRKLEKPDAFKRTHEDKMAVKIDKDGIDYIVDKSSFSEKQIKGFEDTLKNLKNSSIDWYEKGGDVKDFKNIWDLIERANEKGETFDIAKDFELGDTDGVEYEIWKHKKSGRKFKVPIEREDDSEDGEPEITRWYEDSVEFEIGGTIGVKPLKYNGKTIYDIQSIKDYQRYKGKISGEKISITIYYKLKAGSKSKYYIDNTLNRFKKFLTENNLTEKEFYKMYPIEDYSGKAIANYYKKGGVIEFRHNVPNYVIQHVFKTDKSLLNSQVDVERITPSRDYKITNKKGGEIIVLNNSNDKDESRTWKWLDENFEKDFDGKSFDKKGLLLYGGGGSVDGTWGVKEYLESYNSKHGNPYDKGKIFHVEVIDESDDADNFNENIWAENVDDIHKDLAPLLKDQQAIVVTEPRK